MVSRVVDVLVTSADGVVIETAKKTRTIGEGLPRESLAWLEALVVATLATNGKTI
jgi:hypothetical protein